MALPKMLKNMNLFLDAVSYAGVVETVTPPKLSHKMEAFRAGGMVGAAFIDLGLEDDALKLEWTLGGYAYEVVSGMGIPQIAGIALRFAGALQRDDTGQVDAVEIIMRGRHKEIDRGEQKVGDKSSGTKITTNLTYYKESVNGQVLVEIDTVNMIYIVNGVDRLADQRKALGL